MAMWATDVKEILSTPELAEALEDPERVGNQDESSLYVGTRLLLHLMTDWLTNWLMNVHYNLGNTVKKKNVENSTLDPMTESVENFFKKNFKKA